MKKSFKHFILYSLLFFTPLAAKAQDLGVGAIFGEPTGVSGKYWIDSKRAIDSALGYTWGGPNGVHLHASFLIHEPSILVIDQSHWLDLYYGAGPRLKFADDPDGDVQFGLRIPVGLTYLVRGAPIDFFAELAPIIDFAPEVNVFLNAALGVRYYFSTK